MRKVLLAPFVLALAACGSSPGGVTVASAEKPPVLETTTTTVPATTTSAPAPTTTTTVAAPATTSTTRPPTTSTTRPAARTITVSATPGQYYTDILVKGAGCAGPEYGVGLQIRDSAGQAIDGDGGLASPDGTWELHEHWGANRPAGQYSFHATCIVSNGPNVFTYAPQTFTWAG